MASNTSRLSRRDFFKGRFIKDALIPEPRPSITNEEIDTLAHEVQELDARAQQQPAIDPPDPQLVQEAIDLLRKMQAQMVAAQGPAQVTRLGKIKDVVITGAIGTLIAKTGEELYGAFIEAELYPMLQELSGELREIYLEIAGLFTPEPPSLRKAQRTQLPAVPKESDAPQPAPAPTPPSVATPQPAPSTPMPRITNAQRTRLGLDMVSIPAGEFLMGSDKNADYRARDREEPQHPLFLPEYRIAKVPVTVAQFAQFVEATDYITNAEEAGYAWRWTGSGWEEMKGAYWARPRGPGSNVEQKANHPVTSVSWHDAQAFCEWAGVRLPSEAQWEKAASWDATTQTKRTFPWGNEKPDAKRCNFAGNVGDTTPVGHYRAGASPYVCLDMAGNVWEWTSSLYQAYPYKADDGREDLRANGARTLRGGSFLFEGLVRCAFRHLFVPVDGTVGSGFRVVVVSLSPGG